MTQHRKVQVLTLCKNENSYDILLLQTKADRGEFWQPVTGSVDKNEQWEAAAIREQEEETGVKASVHETELEFFFVDRWKRNVHEKVYYSLTEQRDITICPKEHQAYKWIPVKNITQHDFEYESNYNAFLKVCSCLGL